MELKRHNGNSAWRLLRERYIAVQIRVFKYLDVSQANAQNQFFATKSFPTPMDSDEDSFLNELPKMQPQVSKKKNII